MRKELSEFITSYSSKIGTKDKNCDYFGFVEQENSACWVIADGFDEYPGAEIAAKFAVEQVIKDFLDEGEFSKKFLKNAVKNLDKKLRYKQADNSKNSLMHSSVAIVISNYSHIYWASVGNCRLNIFRDNENFFQTKDDTIAQILVDLNKIDIRDIRFHKQRDDLTQAIGEQSKPKINISNKPIKLEEGDTLLLSTIGAWENLDISGLEKKLPELNDPNMLVDELNKEIENGPNKELKNYTLTAIKVNKVCEKPMDKIEKKKIHPLKVAALVSAILVVGYYGFKAGNFFYKRNKIYVAAEEFETSADKYVKKSEYIKATGKLDDAIGQYKKLFIKPKSTNMVAKKLLKPELMNQNLYKTIDAVKDEIDKINRMGRAEILVEEGVKSAKKLDYKTALDKYNDALVVYDNLNFPKYANLIEYNKKGIIRKIGALDELNRAVAHENSGDKLRDEKKYTKAIDEYLKAKKIFLSHGVVKYENIIKDKIDSVTINVSELRDVAATQYNAAERLKNIDYTRAIDNYSASKVNYERVLEADRAKMIDKKIIEMQDKKLQKITEANKTVKTAIKAYSDNELDVALTTINQAVDEFNTIGDPKLISKVKKEKEKIERTMDSMNKLKIGYIHEKNANEQLRTNKFDKAKENFVKASAIYSQFGFKEKEKVVNQQIKYIEDYQKAEGLIKEAKRYEKISDYGTSISFYGDAKGIYENINEKEKVYHITKEVDKLEVKLANQHLKDGDTYYERDEYKSAITEYQAALNYYKKFDGYKAEEKEAAEKLEDAKDEAEGKFLGIF